MHSTTKIWVAKIWDDRTEDAEEVETTKDNINIEVETYPPVTNIRKGDEDANIEAIVVSQHIEEECPLEMIRFEGPTGGEDVNSHTETTRGNTIRKGKEKREEDQRSQEANQIESPKGSIHTNK
ncbi:hypothetical protein HAX54_013167 [Datura stramonium]|uniref:Uncharacterized protein n=1 Tax=Datura stramonium TaxID=4076 RepID=A0ABS8Y762_DATST|nr:hypothetical protein [Datura stramonium]